MDNEREFKGVWIPKHIWLDERLNMLEKGILTEIDSLDNEDTGCFASNEYLANFCQCSETKVSTAIKKLIEFGYVYVKSFDGRKRVLKSRLSNFEKQDLKKLNSEFKNLKYNNKDNNKNNNIIYSQICDYLNEKAKTNYRPTTKSTISAINARLNENYTLEDFKTVIDKKCDEWIGTEMEKYLTPDTLFRPSNFEKYLNQKIIKKQKDFMEHSYTKEELNNTFDDVDDIEI